MNTPLSLTASPTPTPETYPEYYQPQGKFSAVIRDCFATPHDSLRSWEHITEVIAELPIEKKPLILHILKGATYFEAAEMAGIEPSEAIATYKVFEDDLRLRMADSAKRFLENSPNSSPSPKIKQQPDLKDLAKVICASEEKKLAERPFAQWWERSGWLARILAIACCLIFVGAVLDPVTHRLSPDIGDDQDEYDRSGQVTGFHYQKSTWWGFRKTTHDEIRFVKGEGPQYFDEVSKTWKSIPSEAWGEHVYDDREMEVDNRGWHEQ